LEDAEEGGYVEVHYFFFSCLLFYLMGVVVCWFFFVIISVWHRQGEAWMVDSFYSSLVFWSLINATIGIGIGIAT